VADYGFAPFRNSFAKSEHPALGPESVRSIMDHDQGQTKRVETGSHMLLWAFRYSLGRQTYCPSMVRDELRRAWSKLAEETRYCILRDLREEIERDSDESPTLGDACDRKAWREFYEWASEQEAEVHRG
jgi:hypothetical protein